MNGTWNCICRDYEGFIWRFAGVSSLFFWKCPFLVKFLVSFKFFEEILHISVSIWSNFGAFSCYVNNISKLCSFWSFFGPRTSIWSPSRPPMIPWKFTIFNEKNTFLKTFFIQKRVKNVFLKIKKRKKNPGPLSHFSFQKSL